MKVKISTQSKDQIVDITERVEDFVQNQEKDSGVCNIFIAHTTAALTTADLDPGTDLDILESLRKMLPKISYRHPHDPSHTPDHILSSIIGPCVSIPFEGKRLSLGVWQRIILIELDGPRDREIILSIV